MKESRFHCCATCVNFRAERSNEGVRTFCSRLGYDTNPKYQFNCWTPKPQVINKMSKLDSK